VWKHPAGTKTRSTKAYSENPTGIDVSAHLTNIMPGAMHSRKDDFNLKKSMAFI
jgi:hypothetical protein